MVRISLIYPDNNDPDGLPSKVESYDCDEVHLKENELYIIQKDGNEYIEKHFNDFASCSEVKLWDFT